MTLSAKALPQTPSSFKWQGAATVHGRVVLQHRRKYDGAVLLFDANLYLHASDRSTNDPIVGLLTYFPMAGDEFNDLDVPEVYDISANITLMPKNIEDGIKKTILPDNIDDASEYTFVGDIYRLDYIGLVSDGFELTRRPVFSAASTVTKTMGNDRIFEIRPAPYTQICKKCKLTSQCPFKIFVPAIPRWENSPNLQIGGYVSVEGHGISVYRDEDGYPISILIELQQVTLLGKPPGVPPAVKPPVQTNTPSPVAGAKRVGFDYQGSPAPRKRAKKSD